MQFVPSQIQKILVALLCPIGDTLFATPALHILREKFPDTKITVLTYSSNKSILEGNPNVDHLLTIKPLTTISGNTALMCMIPVLRKERFDLLANFSPVSHLLAYTCRIRYQLSFNMPRLWWLTGTYFDQTYQHMHAIDHYLKVVLPLGKISEIRYPEIYLTSVDTENAGSFLKEAGIHSDEQFISIHPGGEGFHGRKQWPSCRFAEVADILARMYNFRIILIGGPADREIAGKIASMMQGKKPIIAAGHTSLKESAAIIKLSRLFIGNDSSPLHLAAAVGTPSIGIFGPSNLEHFRPRGPRSDQDFMIQKPLPGCPCFHFVGCDPLWKIHVTNPRKYVEAVEIGDVLEAAQTLLVRGNGPQPGGLGYFR